MEIIENICSESKLVRDRALDGLKSQKINQEESQKIIEFIENNIGNDLVSKDVNLIYGVICLSNFIITKERESSILDQLKSINVALIDYPKDRIRFLNAETFGILCSIIGEDYFKSNLDLLLKKIDEKIISRDLSIHKELLEQDIKEKQNFDQHVSNSSWSVFVETAGWKGLETIVKTLTLGIENLSQETYQNFSDPSALERCEKLLNHDARYVREIGLALLKSILRPSNIFGHQKVQNQVILRLAENIGSCISDNWTPVKINALHCAKSLYEIKSVDKVQLHPTLLPRICINRFFVADGVRICAQNIWAMVTEGRGRDILEGIYSEALNYYIEQMNVNNHLIREAGCCALTELLSKTKSDDLTKNIDKVMSSIKVCLNDDSWNVRESAGSALSTLIEKNDFVRKLLSHTDVENIFMKLLEDSIPGVRYGAAHSLTKVLVSYDDDSLIKICFDRMMKHFDSMKDQPSDSHGFISNRSIVQGPNVVQVIHESESHDTKYTNQPPITSTQRVSKGNSEGSDQSPYKRPSEPWEKVDGAIFILSEFSLQSPKLFDLITSERYNIFQRISQVCRQKNYNHFGYLIETACITIGKMADNMEKKSFKRYLDDYLIILSLGIGSGKDFAITAAEESLFKVALKIGKLVLKGRIEQHYDVFCTRSLEKYVVNLN